jgi:hypothetical protein
LNYELVKAACHTRYETAKALPWRAFGKIVFRTTALGEEIVQTGNRIVNWQLCIKTVLMYSYIQEMWTRG